MRTWLHIILCLSHSKALDEAQRKCSRHKSGFHETTHPSKFSYSPLLPQNSRLFPCLPQKQQLWSSTTQERGIQLLIFFICKLYKTIYLSNISLQRASLGKHPLTMPSAGMTSHQSHVCCLFHVFRLKY